MMVILALKPSVHRFLVTMLRCQYPIQAGPISQMKTSVILITGDCVLLRTATATSIKVATDIIVIVETKTPKDSTGPKGNERMT
jgi:hypothetical protein